MDICLWMSWYMGMKCKIRKQKIVKCTIDMPHMVTGGHSYTAFSVDNFNLCIFRLANLYVPLLAVLVLRQQIWRVPLLQMVKKNWSFSVDPTQNKGISWKKWKDKRATNYTGHAQGFYNHTLNYSVREKILFWHLVVRFFFCCLGERPWGGFFSLFWFVKSGRSHFEDWLNVVVVVVV